MDLDRIAGPALALTGPGSLDPLLERIGDARATDMAAAGMTNLAQLARERHGSDGVLIGFGGHRERWGNCVPTVLGRRYDAFLWLEETSALRPRHGEPPGEAEPETYPTAM